MRAEIRAAVEVIDDAVEHWDAARSVLLSGPPSGGQVRRLWAAIRALHWSTGRALAMLDRHADRERRRPHIEAPER